MSPKATEGVAAREAPTSIGRKKVASSRTDPFWPAGHLPLKGGDHALQGGASQRL
jgi:hypothetical protein